MCAPTRLPDMSFPTARVELYQTSFDPQQTNQKSPGTVETRSCLLWGILGPLTLDHEHPWTRCMYASSAIDPALAFFPCSWSLMPFIGSWSLSKLRFNLSENYDFVSWDDEIPNNYMETWKSCSKPPTSGCCCCCCCCCCCGSLSTVWVYRLIWMIWGHPNLHQCETSMKTFPATLQDPTHGLSVYRCPQFWWLIMFNIKRIIFRV